MSSEKIPDLVTDVLIIGGGLAGAWAAVAAARAGASVILVDKGYCGTSGVTATAGPGHWWVPPDPEARAAAIRQRELRGGGLADPHWMARILDLTWRTLPTIENYYEFPTDDRGVKRYNALRGPEYLRAMRRLAEDSGVTILDHFPALELLLHPDGSAAGARGIRRQLGGAWTIRAGAVVLATGGCAFMSRLLGAGNNTGDGHLMAAEAGVEFSGMEFCSYYTVAAEHSTMTRSMSYAFARYFDASGLEIPIAGGPDSTREIAAAMLDGPLFCRLDRMPLDIRATLPRISPNFMLPFVRKGIDPFNDKFAVTLRGEGTVRGIGGVRVADDDCQTRVPGLFVAGDVATRELVAGAISGGGAQNSAWALSSGQWAGRGAAALARAAGRRSDEPAEAIGEAGLRPAAGATAVDVGAAKAAVQGEMNPIDKNIFRTGAKLNRSLEVLDGVWREVRDHLGGAGADALAAREAAALTATARWCYRAALARHESRGMHRRDDAAAEDPRLATRLLAGGLDTVWTRPEHAAPDEEAA